MEMNSGLTLDTNPGGATSMTEEDRVALVLNLQQQSTLDPSMVEWRGSKIQQETAQLLANITEHSFDDHAFGCMIGAFVGDSVGSLVEFIACDVPDERLDEVM